MSKSAAKSKKADSAVEAVGEEAIEATAATTGEEAAAETYQEVDKLTAVGIAAADVAKLKAGGCHTVASIVMRTKKDLCNIKGITEAKVDKILEAAAKMMSTSFITGSEVMSRRKQVIRITTGSSQWDTLLGGGIETMSITEVFGEFRTGKTQLCHTLCVAAQLPVANGGANGKVAFIDTEGTFRPERIAPIAERFGVDKDQALDNIIFARAFTHEHQEQLITEVAAKMVEEPFKLLIVDSITALFRVDFSGRGELAERQQKLGRMLSKLIKLAEEFNLAVVVTNQVVSDPGGGAMFVADAKKPIGGHVMAHASTTRLSLRKGRGEQRVCKIYDSPCLPENEAIYQISDGGIVDAKD